jgi:hypothetical protein
VHSSQRLDSSRKSVPPQLGHWSAAISASYGCNILPCFGRSPASPTSLFAASLVQAATARLALEAELLGDSRTRCGWGLRRRGGRLRRRSRGIAGCPRLRRRGFAAGCVDRAGRWGAWCGRPCARRGRRPPTRSGPRSLVGSVPLAIYPRRGALRCLCPLDAWPGGGRFLPGSRGSVDAHRSRETAPQDACAHHRDQGDGADKGSEGHPAASRRLGGASSATRRSLAPPVGAKRHCVGAPGTEVGTRLVDFGAPVSWRFDGKLPDFLVAAHPRVSPFTGSSLGSCLASTVCSFGGRRRRTFAGGRWP